jgi:serine/threonine-protein kinase HipA
MSLHFVGETIDKAQSHYQAETGKLVQLMRGIYADADENIDEAVLNHGVRIAQYLYPNTYLSSASAVLLAPSRDGRLFLSGRRTQRTRIRGLEIIQNKAPSKPSLGDGIVADSMGEFRVNVSSLRQRFLEAFRIRSEHAASIDGAMRDQIAARLIEEYGTPKDATDAVWALARENEWYKEGESAERFLLKTPTASTSRNEATFNLIVAWHGTPIGNLRHDGFEWRWQPLDEPMPNLVRQTTPGKLPPFIVSLLPEGWLESVLNDQDERTALRSGKRYMSNIMIVEQQNDLAILPQDTLLTKLNQFTNNGIFTGTYGGPGRGTLEASFEQNLAQIYQRADTPRLSGVQIKAPMYLDHDGKLSPSTGEPFTHILKPAGTSGFEFLPLVEWTALTLGRAVGFAVPDAALIAMPGLMPPALIVERFDIRGSADDDRLIALEDMCSVLDLPPDAKYSGTIERVGRAVRALSTSPDDDMLLILKRALFAWFIADGDMHLKNMALLKIGAAGSKSFNMIRIAPLYDSVTTRVFPKLEKDRIALKLNGKDERLKQSDFRTLSNTLGIKAGDTEVTINEMLETLKQELQAFVLPKLDNHSVEGKVVVTRMIEICRARIAAFESD